MWYLLGFVIGIYLFRGFFTDLENTNTKECKLHSWQIKDNKMICNDCGQEFGQ